MSLPIRTKKTVPVTESCEILDFALFDQNSNLDELRKRMSDDVFIIGKLAIKGQITIFYAAPNTGKTLLMIHLITNAIKDKKIKGEDVTYINADDSLRGFHTKATILKELGVINVTPGEGGFKIQYFIPTVVKMIEDKKASGKIIIIDTLKKFTDLMNKKGTANFMETMRGFSLAGGTLVFLAHTNKHTAEDGTPIFQGTSDSLDDCDCAYTMQVMSRSETQQLPQRVETTVIHFNSIKSRGDNDLTADYEYTKTKGESYLNMLNSIKKLDKEEAENIKEIVKNELQFTSDLEYVMEVKKLIKEGTIIKGDLIASLQEMKNGLSKKKARELIDRYDGKEWENIKGENNKIFYDLLAENPFMDQFF